MIFFLLLTVSLLLPALLLTDEFLLKDGSRLRGRISHLNGDSFYVTTSLGEVRVPREAIATIEFSSREPRSEVAEIVRPAEAPAPIPPTPLEGELYTHPTGRFQICIPAGWSLDSTLTKSGDESTAAIASPDRQRFVLVASEEFSGTLETYVKLVEIQYRSTFTSYEKISESPITLDGRPGVKLIWKARNPRAENAPLESLVAILSYPGRMTRISCIASAAEFDSCVAVFEAVLNSYASTPF